MVRKSFEVPRHIFEKLELILRVQKRLIFNLPITQKLFDNLTLLAPAAWEILIPENTLQNIEEFSNTFDLIPVPQDLFPVCLKSKISIKLNSDGSQIEAFSLSPELAVIFTLRDPIIPRIFIALGIIPSCNSSKLADLTKQFSFFDKNLIKFLLDLASIRLYRSDQVWAILQKYNYEESLGRLSLYVRDFIKDEFIYEKIM